MENNIKLYLVDGLAQNNFMRRRIEKCGMSMVLGLSSRLVGEEWQEYTSRDIRNSLGVKRECFQDWVNHHYILPDNPNCGKGVSLTFKHWTVLGVGLFKRLLDLGLTRRIAAECFRQWVSRGFQRLYQRPFYNRQFNFIIITFGCER